MYTYSKFTGEIRKEEIDINFSNLDIKKGIWVYFILLIFEGALRKWLLPGIATPLLVIRDPIALWIIFKSIKRGLFPSKWEVYIMLIISIVGTFAALLLGHGSLLVALYGGRILFLHFPLIFIIGKIFTREDVIKMGFVVVCICIPMALLTGLQFYSPQSAFVNRGVGGDLDGAGFSGALGYYRPPGTFSFTNGNHLFFGFVATFIFYFWISKEKISRGILLAATLSLIAAIPLSISRSLLFHVGVTFIFVLFTIIIRPKRFGKALFIPLFILFAFIVLNNMIFFNTAMEAFTSRFFGATESEGGLQGTIGSRYFGGMIKGILDAFDLPFWGYGLGSGTQVGFKVLGLRDFYFNVEDELTRCIGELGFLLGLGVICIRLSVCFEMLKKSYKKLIAGDPLPWILLSYGLLTIPQGQWAQPTALGFAIISGGLMFASLKDPVTAG